MPRPDRPPACRRPAPPAWSTRVISGMASAMASARGMHQPEAVRDAHDAHGVELLGHAHHADLRRDGRARAPGDQDGRQHRPELADQRDAQDVDDVDLGAELAQLQRRQVGQHHADQEADQRGDRQRGGADVVRCARRRRARARRAGRAPGAAGPACSWPISRSRSLGMVGDREHQHAQAQEALARRARHGRAAAATAKRATRSSMARWSGVQRPAAAGHAGPSGSRAPARPGGRAAAGRAGPSRPGPRACAFRLASTASHTPGSVSCAAVQRPSTRRHGPCGRGFTGNAGVGFLHGVRMEWSKVERKAW